MFRNKSLFIRFLLSLLLLSACSIIILGSGIFYWLKGKLASDIQKANQMSLLNTEAVVAKYLEMAQIYAVNLYNSPDVKSVMWSEDGAWNNHLYGALSQVRGILTANKFLSSIYVFNHEGVALDFENTTLADTAKNQLFKLVSSTPMNQSPVFWSLQHRSLDQSIPTMTVYYNEMVKPESSYEGGVALNINLDQLEGYVFSQKPGLTERYYVLGEDGTVLMKSSGTPEIDGGITAAMKDLVIQGEASGAFTRKINGNDYSFSYLRSQEGKMMLVSQTDYSESIKELYQLRNILLLICTVVMLACAAAAWIMSNRIYRPIGHLFGHIRELDNAPPENGQHPELEQASDTLVKISARMNDLMRERDNTLMADWLSAGVAVTGLPARLGETGLVLAEPGSGFCVSVLRIYEPELEEEALEPSQLNEQIQVLRGRFHSFFSGVAYCRSYVLADGRIVLILSSYPMKEEVTPDMVRAKLLPAAEMIRSLHGLGLVAGISGRDQGTDRLKPMFKEAELNLRHTLFYAEDRIIHPGMTGELRSDPLSEAVVERVLAAMRKCSGNDYEEALGDLLVQCRCHSYDASLKALSRLAAAMSRSAGDVLHEGNLTTGLSLLDCYSIISGLQTHRELRQWLDSLFRQAAAVLSKVNAQRTQDVVLDAIAYIREHYHDPALSVNSMADRLSISPPYFSKLFNDTTKSTFPDYVNHIRLETAKELLLTDTGTDIQEIAARVGYNSSTYFATLFKKKYGVSPSKVRLLHVNAMNMEENKKQE